MALPPSLLPLGPHSGKLSHMLTCGLCSQRNRCDEAVSPHAMQPSALSIRQSVHATDTHCLAAGPLARRLMSDWQVELVEDNMQEFHVSFQGPSESERCCLCFGGNPEPETMRAQRLLPEDTGKCTSSCPTSIPTSLLALDSSTGYSIQTSTSSRAPSVSMSSSAHLTSLRFTSLQPAG